MSQINILVVDDEKEIAELVEIYLVSDGYRVFKANDAMAGLEILEKEDIHLVLLDIMMPGMDGLEMCKKIRETNNIPIIMLSAKSTDLDKILGLGTGADDYVVKPFNPLELTARVKSQLRRYTQLNPNSNAHESSKNEISIKGLVINKDNHKVLIYDEEIKLTPIEFDILYLLASNPGRVFSTDEIFEKVWNEKVYEANNTVMVHIRRLRGKMKEDTRQNKIITTVWGVGYKIRKIYGTALSDESDYQYYLQYHCDLSDRGVSGHQSEYAWFLCRGNGVPGFHSGAVWQRKYHDHAALCSVWYWNFCCDIPFASGEIHEIYCTDFGGDEKCLRRGFKYQRGRDRG